MSCTAAKVKDITHRRICTILRLPSKFINRYVLVAMSNCQRYEVADLKFILMRFQLPEIDFRNEQGGSLCEQHLSSTANCYLSKSSPLCNCQIYIYRYIQITVIHKSRLLLSALQPSHHQTYSVSRAVHKLIPVCMGVRSHSFKICIINLALKFIKSGFKFKKQLLL